MDNSQYNKFFNLLNVSLILFTSGERIQAGTKIDAASGTFFPGSFVGNIINTGVRKLHGFIKEICNLSQILYANRKRQKQDVEVWSQECNRERNGYQDKWPHDNPENSF